MRFQYCDKVNDYTAKTENQMQCIPALARSSEDTNNWDDDYTKEKSTTAMPTPHLRDLDAPAPHWTQKVDRKVETDRVA